MDLWLDILIWGAGVGGGPHARNEEEEPEK